MESTPDIRTAVRPRRRRAVTTAAAVAVMFGIPALLVGGQDGETVETARPSTDVLAAGLPTAEVHGVATSPAVRATLVVGPEHLEIPPFGLAAPTHEELVRMALEYIAATQPPPPPPAPRAEPATKAAPPAAAPAPAPQPQPVDVPADAVHQAIAAWFGDVYDQAVAIARCESGLNPNAVSPGGGNWGLFQINVTHRDMVEGMGYSWDQILDPWVNTEVAYTLYAGKGWAPWTCRSVL